MVDATKSIKARNVPNLIASIEDLLNQFTISASETHVSLETFASDSKLHNHFNDASYQSQSAMLGLLKNSFKKLGSPTRLDKAIKLANEAMFTEENGDRDGVPSVMVIYTDGRSKPGKTENFTAEIESLKVSYQIRRKATSLKDKLSKAYLFIK